MVASSSGPTCGSSPSPLPSGAVASAIGRSTGSATVRKVQPPASSRLARVSSAMISFGSVRPSAWRISSACHQPLIRVATPPALSTAIHETIQAGQLRIAIATRSPLPMPAAPSARATRVAWAWRSAKVSRSTPATTASTWPLSAQKASNRIGRVGGKLVTIARPSASWPIWMRPPSPITFSRTASYLRSSALGIPHSLPMLCLCPSPLYEGASPEGEELNHLLTSLITASGAIVWHDLGLDPVAVDLGFFQLRWYSLAYLIGIVLGWWYLLKLIARPGAPMARRHADDMVFYVTLGIILGGRLGYVLFYRPLYYLQNPLEIPQLWDGGMSFHGGVLGVFLGILWMARRHRLDWLRIHDYVACCIPFGLFLGRLANFVNAELWGRESDVAWAVRFPEVQDGLQFLGPPRHPSQLYEAALEGILLFFILW